MSSSFQAGKHSLVKTYDQLFAVRDRNAVVHSMAYEITVSLREAEQQCCGPGRLRYRIFTWNA
jgi:hypothetical protein